MKDNIFPLFRGLTSGSAPGLTLVLSLGITPIELRGTLWAEIIEICQKGIRQALLYLII